MKRILLAQVIVALVCAIWIAHAAEQHGRAEYVRAQRGLK